MTTKKTPGVYIVEKDAFPRSVWSVPTGVPAFVGYTEKAANGPNPLQDVPTRITSIMEFEMHFGGRPAIRIEAAEDRAGYQQVDATRFLLYNSMCLFFGNGGSACWIVSVGPYADDEGVPTKRTGSDLERGLRTLEDESEPSIIVVPDAATLPTAEWKSLSEKMLDQCVRLRDRVAILDVLNGDQPRVAGNDPIEVFRDNIQLDEATYGLAYYPWLNTQIVGTNDVDLRNLEPALAAEFAAKVEAEFGVETAEGEAKNTLTALIAAITDPPNNETQARKQQNALMTLSREYAQLMTEVVRAANVMPPSAAMAGVMTRTDAMDGVWKAPANTPIAGATSPRVDLSAEDRESLNPPMAGLSINPIKSNIEGGVLVWGGRMLHSHDQHLSYISARRTLVFLEQSIKAATEAYVFSPNTSSTWIAVETMIRNFLNNQWKEGALAGAKPEEAYDVRVGLGSTMTASDIEDGYMCVVVHVAMVHPSDFAEITFRQAMQIS